MTTAIIEDFSRIAAELKRIEQEKIGKAHIVTLNPEGQSGWKPVAASHVGSGSVYVGLGGFSYEDYDPA